MVNILQRSSAPRTPLLVRDERPAVKTMRGDLHNILFRYTNILFVFVIAGFAVYYTDQSPSVVFAINLLAIFPSSILMGIGLKCMRARYNGLVQAVLYMTFGYVSSSNILRVDTELSKEILLP